MYSLPNNITMLGAPNLARGEPIDQVISKWPYQGLSHAGMEQGLLDPKLGLFWELICVVQY
jgi:hypothetical protein